MIFMDVQLADKWVTTGEHVVFCETGRLGALYMGIQAAFYSLRTNFYGISYGNLHAPGGGRITTHKSLAGAFGIPE